eukprot:8299292-Pyramimonas_sp.AAC.2
MYHLPCRHGLECYSREPVSTFTGDTLKFMLVNMECGMVTRYCRFQKSSCIASSELCYTESHPTSDSVPVREFADAAYDYMTHI